MASAGQLLLLLVLSSLLLCSLSAPPSSSQQEHHALQKRTGPSDVGKSVKKIVTGGKPLNPTDVKDKIIKVVAAAEPLLDLIPEPARHYVKAVFKLLTGQAGDTEQIIGSLKAEFKKLNEKLDRHHEITLWNTWASGPYQEAEINIMLAWKKFDQFQDECKGSCSDQYKNTFKELHTNMASAPDKLHLLLNAQQPSFITDFGKLLADHVRCHEKSIDDFTVLIDKLMFMGNIISGLYYSTIGVNRDQELIKITHETSMAMSNIHKYCILHPDEYIKKDTLDLIDENQDRSELAKDIRSSLEQKFDRYDWLVVAFITRNSQYSFWFFKKLNKHFLSGFAEVTKGEVSVAVAKQVKGTYSRAEKVKEDITKCLGKKPDCQEVIEKLKQCKDNKGAELMGMVTAVHSYISKSHDSVVDPSKKEQDSDDEYIDQDKTSELPYIHKGQCNKYKIFDGGHFRVMIKSDEEMQNEDPCKDVDCGGIDRGECVPLKNVLKAVCECKMGFHGKECEEKFV
ncbi:uncharacterized protein PAE49_022744 [Odontesthes bonariensis]|uniref:uncharacterized protein LOC142371324 n=1 Tax=Odontesthes bonariensis TaxID=219752 RepID=UPI003F58A5D6